MTLTKLREVQIGGKKNKGVPAQPSQPAGGAPAGGRRGGLEPLVVGGSPRVHLLPKQFLERKKALAMRRRLVIVLVFVIIAVGGGIGLATYNLIDAQQAMTTAQAQSSLIAQQRLKYSAVTQVNADIDGIYSAQKLVGSQEILWQSYLQDVIDTMPKGMTTTGIQTSFDNPIIGATQGGEASSTGPTPLQGSHLATVIFTVKTPGASISGWVPKLSALPGFVDAQVNSVTHDDSDADYTAVVTIHVNKKALSGRFANAGK